MDRIEIKARAKINVALDIVGKRPDNYHEIKTIMQTLTLCDDISITKINRKEIEFKTNSNHIPMDYNNLSYKAAEFVMKEYDLKEGVSIELFKRIPVAAGLGGGSSDCAATLRGMNELFGLSISDDELRAIGKQFGADVPFFINGNTALCEGIGEIITEIEPHPGVNVLLVKPAVHIITKDVYAALDLKNIAKHPNIDEMLKHFDNKNLNGIVENFGNVLETVTESKYPIIMEIKSTMKSCNAMGSLMSGSGSSVFGYFKEARDAKNAIAVLKDEISKIEDIFLTSVFHNN